MKYPEKFRVLSARGDINSFDLSRDHITTSDFLTPSVTYIDELVPGDKFKVNIKSFLRLAPLALPTYGKIDFVTRYFFVPSRLLMKGWLNFITQSPTSQVPIASAPYLTNKDLTQMFFLGASPWVFAVPVTGDNYDFSTINSTSGDSEFFQLTPSGRKLLSILHSLGYNFNFDNSGAAYNTNIKYNAMPLLAYMKVYCDFYYPSKFNGNLIIDEWLSSIEGGHVVFPNDQSFDDFLQLMCESVLEQDFFSATWQSPASPTDVPNAPMMFSDVTNTGSTPPAVRIPSSTANPPSYAPRLSTSAGTTTSAVPNITSYLVNMLDRVQNWLVRNQLSGYRPIDRILSGFGVHMDYTLSNRSEFLKTQTTTIQISDVMSTADTTSAGGAPIGGYTGAGFGYQGDNEAVEYTASEFGYLIAVSTIRPATGYYQGVNPMCTRLSATDFFTPDFDGLGVDAVMRKHLYNSYTNQNFGGGFRTAFPPDSVFGFCPRYAQGYKSATDILSGDFRVWTVNGAIEGFHMFRSLCTEDPHEDDYDVYADAEGVPNLNNTLNFCFDRNKQYDRIFQQGTDGSLDHFYIIHRIDVKAKRPMTSIIDGVQFSDSQPRNMHHEVEISNNGQHF